MITISKEPFELSNMFSGKHEYCVFRCGNATAYWNIPTNKPICPRCAETKTMDELYDLLPENQRYVYITKVMYEIKNFKKLSYELPMVFNKNNVYHVYMITKFFVERANMEIISFRAEYLDSLKCSTDNKLSYDDWLEKHCKESNTFSGFCYSKYSFIDGEIVINDFRELERIAQAYYELEENINEKYYQE